MCRLDKTGHFRFVLSLEIEKVVSYKFVFLQFLGVSTEIRKQTTNQIQIRYLDLYAITRGGLHNKVLANRKYDVNKSS